MKEILEEMKRSYEDFMKQAEEFIEKMKENGE